MTNIHETDLTSGISKTQRNEVFATEVLFSQICVEPLDKFVPLSYQIGNSNRRIIGLQLYTRTEPRKRESPLQTTVGRFVIDSQGREFDFWTDSLETETINQAINGISLNGATSIFERVIGQMVGVPDYVYDKRPRASTSDLSEVDPNDIDSDIILGQVLNNPLSTAEEEIFYARAWQLGHVQSAKDILTLSNIKFVKFKLSGYRRKPYYDDVIHEGIRGLMRAIDLYDYNCGKRLYTYAHYWIHEYASLWLTTKNPTVPFGKEGAERLKAITTLTEQLRQKHPEAISDDGRISPDGMAYIIENGPEGLTIKKLSAILTSSRRFSFIRSLSDPIYRNAAGYDGETELLGVIPDQTTPSPETIMMQTDLRERLLETVQQLKQPARRVVTLRYRLQPPTRTEVATIAKISEAQVAVILRKHLQSPPKGTNTDTPEMTVTEMKVLELCFERSPITTDDLGKVFGVTKARISQILIEAMGSLKSCDLSSIEEYI